MLAHRKRRRKEEARRARKGIRRGNDEKQTNITSKRKRGKKKFENITSRDNLTSTAGDIVFSYTFARRLRGGHTTLAPRAVRTRAKKSAKNGTETKSGPGKKARFSGRAGRAAER